MSDNRTIEEIVKDLESYTKWKSNHIAFLCTEAVETITALRTALETAEKREKIAVDALEYVVSDLSEGYNETTGVWTGSDADFKLLTRTVLSQSKMRRETPEIQKLTGGKSDDTE